MFEIEGCFIMKFWKVTAQLFFDINHIESVIVNADTKRKAKFFAKLAFKHKYSNIVNMINIQKVERLENL